MRPPRRATFRDVSRILPSAHEVRAAAARIGPYVQRTPLVESPALAALLGGDVYLKLENRQPGGSFKLRGAVHALLSLSDAERAAGVVASSAGNHGIGVAMAARQLGIAATIFVPASAPDVKRDRIAALGASVDASQPHYDLRCRRGPSGGIRRAPRRDLCQSVHRTRPAGRRRHGGARDP